MLVLLEDKIATPVGPLWILCDENFHLRAIEWEEHSDRMEQLLDIHYRHEGYTRVASRNPGGLSQKLADYFEGDLAVIETLPTATGVLTSSVKSGRPYAPSHADRLCITGSLPNSWAAPGQREPWGRQTGLILSALSFLAIA